MAPSRTFAAIPRLAACKQFSCRVYAGCMQGVAKTAKPPAMKADGFAFIPTNADFREGIVGAVELAIGGEAPTLRPPMRRRGAEGFRSDRKTIGSAQ